MKASKFFPGLAIAATLFSIASASAAPGGFTGSFAGFFAPANWTTTVTGSTGFILAPQVITGGAPDNVTIVGSLGSGTVATSPTTIDYSIVLPGSGPQTVSFSYLFFRPDIAPTDTAQVLRNGTDIMDFTLINSSQQATLTGVFNGGDVLDFRLTSVNVNQFDFLQIAPIPEPSTLALAGLGGVAMLAQLRRKSAKR